MKIGLSIMTFDRYEGLLDKARKHADKYLQLQVEYRYAHSMHVELIYRSGGQVFSRAGRQ